MFKTCPDPIDVQDLQFKLHCRLKVFSNKELGTFPKSNSLISCASRYGLLFIGSSTSSLQVIQIKCVENYSPKDKDISNYPRRKVALLSRPEHICVNCDSTILAVVTERDSCPNVTFYDVLSFLKQNISIIKEVRLSSTPGTYVKEIGWNPTLPSIFTACKSDGTLGVYEIKGTAININELPAASEATCFCWSPKGKQIAVGSKNSRITQYKPDLKAVKVVNQPPLEGAHSLISLQWVSNYQFIGIYQSAQPEGTAKLVVVDAPKTGDSVYTNYEDVCYSGNSRLPQFYMILQQPQWNILMVASSNSTELGVLGGAGDTWTQWIISDSARAELPLSPERQETLPVGLALDISSTRPLPWNESTIPPCPYLLILSHHGVLCFFSVVNLKEGIPGICAPPDPVSDLSGLQQFVSPESTTTQPIETTKAAVSTVVVTTTNQATVFGAKVLTQPQPTYAAPVTLFAAKPSETKPFFGSQTNLTPIKPQQSAPQPLFSGQTFITPISKQQTTAEKYSAIFSALNTPSAVPPPAESKPIVISTQNVPKAAPSVEQPTAARQNITVTPVKPAEPPKPVVNLRIKEETDVLLAQMLKDESTSLESELKALLHQGKLLNINIGSDEEKVELVRKIEYLQEFIKEIVDISIGENAEVHYLKQNLIQSWAWYEEARSRYNASKDETVSLLLRSQPLDSATEKKQADIRKMMYYIESQITQASKALDEQWDNFQDYAKKVHRTKMPTMEAIFQAMVRQNVILQKQSYILKDIAGRLKGKSRGANVPSLLLSIESTGDLEDSLNRLKLGHPQDIYQMQYQRVLNRTKNLSETKTNKLRDLLKNREVPHVTAVKPQLSTSLMLQSPESKSKRLLSNLAALGMPVSPPSATAPVPKVLNFAHSTPIRETKPDKTETAPITTKTDTKIFTFKKAEKSNLPATTNTFIPLAKSASVFSNLPQEGIATHTPSAFVPTQVNFGGGSKFSFASTATAATTSIAKTTTAATTTKSTFSFGAASASLPKFSAPPTPKTPDAPAGASLGKPSLPQFNFSSNLSIVPVEANKKDVTTTAATSTALFGTGTTAKSGFSFGGTSNLLGMKLTTETTQANATTTSSNFFSTQVSKPFSGTATSNAPSTFGITTTVPKLSAFSAVTTSASNVAFPTAAPNFTSKVEESSPTKPSVFATTLTTDSVAKSVTTSSIFTALNIPTVVAKPTTTVSSANSVKPSPVSTNLTVTAVSTIPTTATPSIFGATTTKHLSMFQTSSTPSATTEVTSVLTQHSSQTLAFGSRPTSAVSTVSSSISMFNVTTSTSTKPTSSVTSSAGPAVPTQSLFFGGVQTTAVSSAGLSTTVSTSSTSSIATKPSIFGSATVTPQSTTVASSSLPPPNLSVGSPQLGLAVASTALQTPSGTTSFAQPPVFTTTKSATCSASTTTTQSIFNSAKTASTQPSIFGSSAQPQLFGETQSTTSGLTTITQSTSIFGAAKPTATSQPSIFGTSVASPQPSIFGTAVTSPQSSIFGGTTSGTSTTTQTTSIFNTSVSSTQPSIFGAATPSTTPSIFGSSTSPKTTATSIFGSGTSTTQSQSSMFGTPSTVSSTSPSIFGAISASNQSSLFNTTPVSTQQGSIFGGAANTSSAPLFGAASAPTQTSIFGGVKPVSTTKSSIFGDAQATTAQSSIFGGSAVPSTQTSVFGASSTSATSPFSSGFGSTSTASSPFAQTTPGFGAPKTTASTFSSGFGSPAGFGATPSTTSSIFGQPASFGGTSTSVFGTPTTATNLFGSSTSTFGANTSANVFGAPVSSSSSFSFAGTAGNASNQGAFGFGGLNVGSPPTTSSVFGGGATFGQATAANPFGRTEQKSPFGGGTSVFGGASSSGSIFGSSTAASTQGGFGSSSFGSPSTFGQQSAFGQSTFGNTSFGTPQPGPFSGGSGAVAQTGFGSPNFAKPSGFGSSPVFGGSPQPAFGAAPSFGGAPAFGATPAFGSPNKIFGGNTPTATFGSASTTNAGFGNLANQNTVGFGNLAQQAASPNSTSFSGSSSFSTWR